MPTSAQIHERLVKLFYDVSSTHLISYGDAFVQQYNIKNYDCTFAR